MVDRPIDRLMAYLTEPPESLWWLFHAAIFSLASAMLGYSVLVAILGRAPVLPRPPAEAIVNLRVFVVMSVALLLEEITFRLPLIVLRHRRLRASRYWGWLVVGASLSLAALFGWAHGTPRNILVQGLSGLVFTAAFFKYGGLTGRIVTGLAAAYAVHLLHDSMILVPTLVFAAIP